MDMDEIKLKQALDQIQKILDENNLAIKVEHTLRFYEKEVPVVAIPKEEKKESNSKLSDF